MDKGKCLKMIVLSRGVCVCVWRTAFKVGAVFIYLFV